MDRDFVTDLEVQHGLFKCCIAGLSVQRNFTIIVQWIYLLQSKYGNQINY